MNDTEIWRKALENYRLDSGDQTAVRDMPTATLSRITRTHNR